MVGRFKVVIIAFIGAGVLAACVSSSSPSSLATPGTVANLAEVTNEARCIPPVEALPSLTEGPYFKVGSPERTSLIETGTAGEPLTLSGFVFDTQCTPQATAELDFWQADGNGSYDNAGFHLRGHQFTDATGAYTLRTVVPGLYPGRTEHIHVKITPRGESVLTTQLYFPDVAANRTDLFFNPRLLMRLQRTSDGWIGVFDFIVPAP